MNTLMYRVIKLPGDKYAIGIYIKEPSGTVTKFAVMENCTKDVVNDFFIGRQDEEIQDFMTLRDGGATWH